MQGQCQGKLVAKAKAAHEEGENLTLKNLATSNYAYTRKDFKHGLNNNCISYDPFFAKLQNN